MTGLFVCLGEVPARPALRIHELRPLVRLLSHQLHQLPVLLRLLRRHLAPLRRLLKGDALSLRDVVQILQGSNGESSDNRTKEKLTRRRNLNICLKGSGKRKIRVVGNLATVRRWFRTVAIHVCLIFNVAVVFSSMYFCFLFVKLS